MNFLSNGQQQKENEFPDRTNVFREYDFIIVGAGTAGCVLANRLTEVPQWKVLLIEAGADENLIMDIPLLANYLQFTEANWKYKTEPGPRYCLGFNKNECSWPRGKVMGGSSVLNYMIYTRGNRRDYDLWSNMGNPGWSFKEVLPYFKKVENFKVPEYQDPEYHGTNGYLDVGHIPFATNVAKMWVEASQQAGHKLVDYNGKNQTGTSFLQTSMRKGSRLSSNKAYLYSIRHRTNLHVLKNTVAIKLLIDEQKRVKGVEIFRQKQKYRIYAKKEVILSAGAINSPQLLMLSGIGPRDDLEKIGIPVVQDLKVGYNLMDHIAAGGLIFTVNKQNIALNTNTMISRIDYLVEFLNRGTGPLTIPGGCEALNFIDLKNPQDEDGWPDMEHLFVGGSVNDDPNIRRNFGMRDDIYNSTYNKLRNSQSFMVFPMLMRPKSKGRIKLRNKNPMAHPLIYPNYFSEEDDIRVMVDGMKEAVRISEQPALKNIGAKIYDSPIPNCKHLGFGTDAYFACQAMHFTLTIYHISGTCKMGPEGDSTAVVDPRLKVHGIEGLRVIDASIMPEIPAAHTNSPVYMIAEKGADLIKEDWGKLRL